MQGFVSLLICKLYWKTRRNEGVRILTKGVRKGRGFGVKPPLELDILQKFCYLRKGD